MRFALGYQLPDEGDSDTTVAIVRDYASHVAEVYFAWIDARSGRSPVGTQAGCTDWCAQEKLERDLLQLRALGVKLDLLLNANCYGGDAVSQRFENQIGSLLTHLEDRVGGADIVTTTSPFVARTVKKHFPRIEVRASVNMRLGDPTAMSLLADLFDSYYVQRDHQRDLAYCRRLKAWADAAGKKLCLLANSGCLHLCPSQTFHDNLVAHEPEIAERRNVPDWNPILCWRTYKNRDQWVNLLRSTWIRPEDLHHYTGLFDVVKLATRMHEHPRMVLDAYVRGLQGKPYRGNLLNLFEPSFAPALMPDIIANERFPADWFAQTSSCGHRCESCAYCANTLAQVLIHAPE